MSSDEAAKLIAEAEHELGFPLEQWDSPVDLVDRMTGALSDQQQRITDLEQQLAESQALVMRLSDWVDQNLDQDADVPFFNEFRAIAAAPESVLAARDAQVIKVWVNRVRTELEATHVAGINLGDGYLSGVYSALQQASDHAARLENDAEYRKETDRA